MDNNTDNLDKVNESSEEHVHHEHHGHHEHHRHHEHHSHSHHSNNTNSKSNKTSKKKTPVKNVITKIGNAGKNSSSLKKHSVRERIIAKFKKMSRIDRIKVLSVTGAVLCCIIVAVVILTVNSSHVHEFGEWTVTEEATCTVNGSAVRTCKCGKTQTKVLNKDHELEFCSVDTVSGGAEYKCSVCRETFTKIPDCSVLGLPVINISFENISKNSYSEAQVSYSSESNSFESKALIKYQGSSSLQYPKKNYNVKLRTDEDKKYKVEMHEGWGKHSKYTLKANYFDASSLRNICSAKLYGQMAHDGTRSDYYTTLVNGGAVDGFPVAVYINDEFNGLYTLNIPKDEWLFDFKDGEGNKAILQTTAWNGSVDLSKPLNADVVSSGFEIVYNSTGEDYLWAVYSFNDFIDFLNRCDKDTFVSGINQYVDVDVAIDTLIFVYASNAIDNISKNINWVTLDGKVWNPIPYDLDRTWGLTYEGSDFASPSMMTPHTPSNALFEKLMEYFPEKISARYNQLLTTVLTTDNVRNTFQSSRDDIPDFVMNMENLKWINKSKITTNNIDQIVDFAGKRFERLKKYFS